MMWRDPDRAHATLGDEGNRDDLVAALRDPEVPEGDLVECALLVLAGLLLASPELLKERSPAAHRTRALDDDRDRVFEGILARR